MSESAQPGRTASYSLLIGVYLSAIAAFSAWFRAAGRTLPERVGPGDLALLGAATYKLSRLVTKDRVAAPLRAPFTEGGEPVDMREVSEKPAGRGPRRAIGELIACPFCLGQWIATALAGAFAVAPRATRFLASILTVVAIGDLLHMAHVALRERAG